MQVGDKNVTNPMEMIEIIMAFDSRDWMADKRDRLLYTIVFDIPEDAIEDYKTLYGFTDREIAEYRELHAKWDAAKRLVP